MVCGVIFFDNQTHLVDIFGSVKAQFYDDDILEPRMLLFLLRHSGYAFQHDNPRSHITHVVMNCLQVCPLIPWPASSYNLSNRAYLGRYEKAIATIPNYWRFNSTAKVNVTQNSAEHHSVTLWVFSMPDDSLFPSQRLTNTFFVSSNCNGKIRKCII